MAACRRHIYKQDIEKKSIDRLPPFYMMMSATDVNVIKLQYFHHKGKLISKSLISEGAKTALSRFIDPQEHLCSSSQTGNIENKIGMNVVLN